jgi:predicted MPP superfamily phosphohydrolase
MVILGGALLGGTAALWHYFWGDWSLTAGVALFLAGILLTDGLLLWLLPVWKLSFGPWAPQFLALALPRLAAAVVLALVSPWIGVGWAVGSLIFLQTAGLAAFIWGAYIEPFRLQLTHLTIAARQWPAAAPPLRLLHISDLHIERLTRREAHLLTLIQQAQPDLIVITGDYLNLSYTRDPAAQGQLRQLLAQIDAPLGVYASLGSPTVDLRDRIPGLLDGLPLRLLRDEWVPVDLGGERPFVIIGLDCDHDLAADAARLANVAAAAPADAYRLLLFHAPDIMPEASRLGIDLYLAGHTHGGQIRLPWYGAIFTSSQLGKRHEMGHYRQGECDLYVSRGMGLEGMSAPRIRFLSPPEITLVEIRGSG